jgi:hypothetical protein
VFGDHVQYKTSVHAIETYIVRSPIPNQVGRHRSEDLGKDFSVLLRSVIPQIVGLISEGICDRPILTHLCFVVVRERRGPHERGNRVSGTLARLGLNETEML